MSYQYGNRWKTTDYSKGRCICGKRSRGIRSPRAWGEYCSHDCARAAEALMVHHHTLAAPTVPSRPAARPASSPARSRESSEPPGEGTVPAARDTTPEGTA